MKKRKPRLGPLGDMAGWLWPCGAHEPSDVGFVCGQCHEVEVAKKVAEEREACCQAIFVAAANWPASRPGFVKHIVEQIRARTK